MAATRRILVTGGAGFIGATLVHSLVEAGHDVTVLDKLTYAGDRSRLEGVEDRIRFVEGAIEDRELVTELYADVDVAVNLAAESHVDRSIEAGEPFVESNVKGAFVMMDAMRDEPLQRLLHMSTDEVYGSIQDGAFTEKDTLEPSSPYSASKAGADMFFSAFRTTYDLPITVARCTNIYGPRQHPEKLIPKLITNTMNGEELPIYGDGTNRRQWLYVDDVCRALTMLLEQGRHEVYNIGSGEEQQNVAVARLVVDLLDASEDLITFVEDRKGHDFRYALDDTKLRDALGWTPSVSFEEGLQRTIDWFSP